MKKALLAVDIDHFRKINDNHGHAVGDHALTILGARLTRCVRSQDVVARFGGEEFVVYLPSTAREAATAVAERLRESICRQPFPVEEKTLSVTISVGAYSTRPFSLRRKVGETRSSSTRLRALSDLRRQVWFRTPRRRTPRREPREGAFQG